MQQCNSCTCNRLHTTWQAVRRKRLLKLTASFLSCSPPRKRVEPWCWLRNSALCTLVQVRDLLCSLSPPLRRCCKRAFLCPCSGRIREGSDLLQCHHCATADGAWERRSGEPPCVSKNGCSRLSLEPRFVSAVIHEHNGEVRRPFHSCFPRSLTTTRYTARVSSSGLSTTLEPAESPDG